MSQINDALKRAKDAQREQPPNLPPTPPPSSGEPPPRSGGMGWFFLILLILIIACIFLVLASMHRSGQPPISTSIVSTQTVQVVAVAPVPKTNPVVVPPKPVPPPLKLQGILFINPPQAIVNGQTVYVGDKVAGFRVQSISQNNVIFLAPDGTQKKLVLDE